MTPIIDLHTHILPGVDDGAQDVEEGLAAVEALAGQGVEVVVATPHFKGSLLERPARARARLELFDAAFEALTEAADGRGLEIRIERAVELKLDAPGLDLSDPRLRLGDTRVALVEFASFQLPPFAGNQLKAVGEAGWVPLLAHPERYLGADRALDRIGAWVENGTLLQVNARSLLGQHGAAASHTARALLSRGWVCCLASDFHARGVPEWTDALALLGEVLGPRAWIDDLVYGNPRRLLADETPQPVPPREIPTPRRSRKPWR